MAATDPPSSGSTPPQSSTYTINSITFSAEAFKGCNITLGGALGAPQAAAAAGQHAPQADGGGPGVSSAGQAGGASPLSPELRIPPLDSARRGEASDTTHLPGPRPRPSEVTPQPEEAGASLAQPQAVSYPFYDVPYRSACSGLGENPKDILTKVGGCDTAAGSSQVIHQLGQKDLIILPSTPARIDHTNIMSFLENVEPMIARMEDGIAVTFGANINSEKIERKRLALTSVVAFKDLDGGRIVEQRDDGSYVEVCWKKAEQVAFALLQHLALNTKNSPGCLGTYFVDLATPRAAAGQHAAYKNNPRLVRVVEGYAKQVEEGMAQVTGRAKED